MHVIVLAAGFGSRLGREEPKALLRIGGGPVLNKLVTSLWVPGVTCIRVVHNALHRVHFKAWRNQLMWIPRDGVRRDPPYVRLLCNGVKAPSARLGSVGDLAYGIGTRYSLYGILGACGDNLFPQIEYEKLVGDGKTSAITVRRFADLPTDMELGRVRFSAGEVDEITGYHESKAGWAFAGPFYLSPLGARLIFDYCDKMRKHGILPDSLGDFFNWLREREPVRAVISTRGPFFDLGTPGSLRLAERFFIERRTRR